MSTLTNVEAWTGYEVSEQVLQEAAEWLVELEALNQVRDKGTQQDDVTNLNSQASHTAFFDWLESDPSHQQAYAELSELWAKTACLQSALHLLEQSSVLRFPSNIKLGFNTNGESLSYNTSSTILNDVNSVSHSPEQEAPPWCYALAIGLIGIGMSLPFIQTFL